MTESGSTSMLRGGREDKDALVAEFLGWAYALAARFKNRGVPSEDLRQVAAEALVKAAHGYDPDRGFPFAAYATSTILGMLRRYFRDHTWCVRIPRRLQEMVLAVTAAREELTQSLGHSPSASELAERLGLSVDDVLAALEAVGAYSAVGFGFIDEIEPVTVGRGDPGYELTENLQVLGPAIAQLPERDKRMLAMRFGAEMSQTQIAEQIGISQMQVSRVLRRCLDQLREELSTG